MSPTPQAPQAGERAKPCHSRCRRSRGPSRLCGKEFRQKGRAIEKSSLLADALSASEHAFCWFIVLVYRKPLASSTRLLPTATAVRPCGIDRKHFSRGRCSGPYAWISQFKKYVDLISMTSSPGCAAVCKPCALGTVHQYREFELTYLGILALALEQLPRPLQDV